MINFKDLSQKYKDKGYVTFPVTMQHPSKGIMWKDIRDNWENIESIITHPAQTGIGLACGEQSGIVAVDIDVNDQEFIKQIPYSAFSKFGSKGITYFFQYEPYLKSFNKHGTLDFISDGKYTVMPESDHPLGMKYKWVGESILNVDKEMLPTLSLEQYQHIERISEAYSKKMLSSIPDDKRRGGRNNKLKDMVSAITYSRYDEMPIADLILFAANEIYEYDKYRHDPRLFTDKSERMIAKTEEDALKNAEAFASSCIKSVIPEVLERKKDVIKKSDTKVVTSEKFIIKNYPKLTGILKDIYEFILESSYVVTPNLAVGGAIATLATSIGRSLKLEDCKANNYYLFVASSGNGKSSVLNSMMDVVDEKRLDSADFLSSQAIVSLLSNGCEKIALNDEISQMFKIITDGGAWQSRMIQSLTMLWSVSDGKFMLPKTAKVSDKEEDDKFIEKPFINLVGATTFSELKSSVDKSFFTSGLFPRFLIFIDKAERESCRVRINVGEVERRKKEVISTLRSLESGLSSKLDKLHPVCTPDAISIEETKEAYEKYGEIANKVLDMVFSYDDGSVLRSIYSRGIQHIKKLALISAVSNYRNEIIPSDYEWAYEIFSISIDNAIGLIAETSAENRNERSLERVFNIIKESGKIGKREIGRKTQFLKGAEREAILKDLLDSERIVKLTDNIKGQLLTSYAVNNDKS